MPSQPRSSTPRPALARHDELLARALGPDRPTAATLARLVRATFDLDSLQPWLTLANSDLIIFSAPGQPRCYCAVMGNAHQSYGLQAFVGADGLAALDLLHRSDDGGIQNMALLLARNYNLTAEIVGREEIELLDKSLLRVAGFNPARGFVPRFLVLRPGHTLFIPTEDEARLLADCLDAVAWTYRERQEVLARHPWNAGLFPLVRPRPGGGYEFELVPPDEAPALAPALELPADDRRRLQSLPQTARAIEMDCFFFGSIGHEPRRQAAGLLAMAVDDAGFILCGEPGAIGQGGIASVAALLHRALMTAIGKIGGLPARILFRTPELAAQLATHVRPFGIVVEVSPSLAGLDPARAALLESTAPRPQ